MSGVLRCAVSLPLDRFTLQVDLRAQQQVTGVFGPSGSGKTSLLECVAGLRRGVRGSIWFGQTPWLDSERGVELSPERRGIGYVPQGALLFPHLDVAENLQSGSRRRRGADFEHTRQEVVEVLELGALLGRDVNTLSGGERQRVALGRALCSGPQLLILDEPTASLDLPLRRRLLPFLRRVRERFDLPVLVVSHDPLEVQALCDGVFALRDGAVVAQGPPAEVLSDPRVLALEPEQRLPNVLMGLHAGTTPTGTRVQLGTDGPTITVRGHHGRRGDPVLVSLGADQILLANREPQGLSAANVLPVRLQALEPHGPLSTVRASFHRDLPPLLIEVTGASLERLGLREGSAAHVVFKAASCQVLGAAG